MKTENTDKQNKRSDATRDRIRAKALERGKQRTADIHSRVLATIAMIEQEILENDGIYPYRKGRVSGAEIARRADIHPTTLFSDSYTTLAETVRDWVNSLKNRHPVSVHSVKRSLAERVSDWKELFNRLAQSHRDTELELQQVEAELNQLREILAVTKKERDELLVQLNKIGSSVVPLRSNT